MTVCAEYLKYCDSLYAISVAICDGNLEKSLEVIIDQLTQTLGIQRCVIAKVCEEKGIYRFVAGVAKDGPDHTLGINYFIDDHAVIKGVVERGQLDYRPNPENDPQLAFMRQFIINADVKSILFVPVINSGQVEYIIILDAIRERKCFGEHEIQFVSRVAEIIRCMKAHERKIKHQNRLAMTGLMCAAFAHEMRNPIITIGGFARRIVKKINNNGNLDTADVEAIKKYANVITEAVGRAEKSLKAVLDGRGADAGVKLERTELSDFVRGVLEESEIVSYKEEVTIRFFGRKDICNLKIDRQKFSLALKNLLMNAVEHARGDSGGVGIIVSIRQNRAFVEIAVRNPGNLPDPPEQVFEPFYTTGPDGAGLGLTLSQSLIRAHHPDASIIARQDGDRVEFAIRLPLTLSV